MKQLTKEQAIQLSKIDFSDKFSPINLSITQLFQDNLFIDVNDFKSGLSALFKREIHTYQLNNRLRNEYMRSFPPAHLDRLETVLFSIVSEMEAKTNNEYQKGFEAGRAEYKATVLSLERRIEELSGALELASVDSAEFGYVDKNGQNIPCGGYYRRYNYLYQTYWSNVEFGYKGKIVARLSDKDKTTWLKEVSSCGFVLVSDGQSELIVDPKII